MSDNLPDPAYYMARYDAALAHVAKYLNNKLWNMPRHVETLMPRHDTIADSDGDDGA